MPIRSHLLTQTLWQANGEAECPAWGGPEGGVPWAEVLSRPGQWQPPLYLAGPAQCPSAGSQAFLLQPSSDKGRDGAVSLGARAPVPPQNPDMARGQSQPLTLP